MAGQQPGWGAQVSGAGGGVLRRGVVRRQCSGQSGVTILLLSKCREASEKIRVSKSRVSVRHPVTGMFQSSTDAESGHRDFGTERQSI